MQADEQEDAEMEEGIQGEDQSAPLTEDQKLKLAQKVSCQVLTLQYRLLSKISSSILLTEAPGTK